MLNLEHFEDHDQDSLVDAFIQRDYTREPAQLSVYDDCFGDLFVYGQEYGPTLLIRAHGESNAYEIAIDESRTIEDDDVIEAYGFYTTENKGVQYLCSDHEEIGISTDLPWCNGARLLVGTFLTVKDVLEHVGELVERYELALVEGYQYQSNASGTGIVCTGHYEWMVSLESYNQHGTDETITPVWRED